MKTNKLLGFGKLMMLAAFMGFAFVACNDDDDPPPRLSDENDILTFAFKDLNPEVTGTISGTNITATVPYNQEVTALVPTITISEDASIQPASGIAQNFTNPVTYTVTAEDGTQKTYTVTVTREDPPKLVASAVWQKNLASGGLPAWFTANNDREIAVFGNQVFVHNNNDRIRVISATDGADIVVKESGEFIDGKQNFSSGNIFLLGMDVDTQGKIIASNLRVGDAAENPWNVYKWDNKDADQELLFQFPTPTGYRLGDNLTVVGDVTANASIFAPSAGGSSNKILKFNIAGGVVNTTPVEIALTGVTGLGNGPDVALVSNSADANMIVVGTGIGNVAEYTQSGTLVGQLPDALKEVESTKMLFAFSLAVDAFELQGRKVVAAMATDYTVGGAGPADKGYLYLIDYTDGWQNVQESNIIRVPLTPADNIDKNVNATGGVSVVVNDNGTATVYAMLTNFGIGVYTVSFE